MRVLLLLSLPKHIELQRKSPSASKCSAFFVVARPVQEAAMVFELSLCILDIKVFQVAKECVLPPSFLQPILSNLARLLLPSTLPLRRSLNLLFQPQISSTKKVWFYIFGRSPLCISDIPEDEPLRILKTRFTPAKL